jgi:hypothetical protein
MTKCTDHYLPAGTVYYGVQVFITSYGTKQHLEFANIHEISGAIRGLTDDGRRGVFGYFSWGQVYTGLVTQWSEPEYLNWGVNIFYPPNRHCNVIRVWSRFDVGGKIWWLTENEYKERNQVLDLQHKTLP